MRMLFNVHLVCGSVRMMCDVPGLYSCARGDGFPASFAMMRPPYDLRSGRFLRDFIMVIIITAMTLLIDAVIRVPKYSQDPEPIRCIDFR